MVTVTLTAPGACVGVVAVIDVASTTTTLVAAEPPKLTVAPTMKLLPVRVTTVPPREVPETGERLPIDGAGSR